MIAIVRAMLDLPPLAIEELISAVNQSGHLADLVNYSPAFTFEDRIASLEALDPLERIHKVQRKRER